MSPTMGMMLVNDVVPRLRMAARSVPKVGADDNEEIAADMTLQAAPMRCARRRSWMAGSATSTSTGIRTAGRRSTNPATDRSACTTSSGRAMPPTDSSACTLRKAIAADLVLFFGPDVIARLLAGIQPGWESDLRAGRGRHLHCAVTRNDGMPVPA